MDPTGEPHGITTHEGWSTGEVETTLQQQLQQQQAFEEVLLLLKYLCRTKAICGLWNKYYNENVPPARGVAEALVRRSPVNRDFIMRFLSKSCLITTGCLL